MRIVMVSCDYFPTTGGIAGHIRKLSLALSRRGHRVVIVNHRYGNGEPSEWNEEGVRVLQSHLGRENSHVKLTLPAYWVTGRGELLRGALHAGALDAEDAILHVHDLLEGIGLVRSIPAFRGARVLTNHSSTYLRWIHSPPKMAILGALVGCMRAVIAPSRELERESVRLGAPVAYIPNGVDLDAFRPPDGATRAEARRRLGVDASLVLLSPRRLVRKNGVDLLVEAIPKIAERSPNVIALLAGDGPEAGALRARAQTLGVAERVRFLGDVGNDQMEALYHAADLAVVPSRLEATSLAALEASACGLAIVATRAGGLPEVVEDGGTGLLVDVGDHAALASAAIALLADPDRRARFGAAARARVEARFGWEAIAAETEAIYAAALRGVAAHRRAQL
ncbi:MAG: glycosyltransferase family 4 protein [bacterium]